MIELFGQYASKYDAWFRGAQGSALFPAELQAIQLLLNQLVSRRQEIDALFLEIGVGTGAFAAECGVRNWRLVVYEAEGCEPCEAIYYAKPR